MSADMIIGRATTSTVVIYPDIQELLGHIDPPKKVAVATGCPLCDEIWSSIEAYKNDIGSRWDEPQAIIMKDGEPWLYIPIDDYYYSDMYMQINYCPKCGRKLVEERSNT